MDENRGGKIVLPPRLDQSTFPLPPRFFHLAALLPFYPLLSPLSRVYASESDFCPAKRDGNVDEQRVTRPSLVANLTDRLTTRTIKRTSASAAMSLINEPALIVLLDYSVSKGERRLSDCLYLRFQFASITSPFFLFGSKVIGKKRN